MRGAKLGAAAVLASAAILCGGTTATAAAQPGDQPASAKDVFHLVGSVSAPFIVVNVPCLGPGWTVGAALDGAKAACNVLPAGQ